MNNTEFTKYDYCYNTKQDFYKMLFQLDYIFVECEKGNHDAINIFIDFERDIADLRLCKLYADIVCGRMPMTKIQSVYECMADRLGQSVKQVRQEMDAEIDKFVTQKKREWADWANQAYKGFSKYKQEPVRDWGRLFGDRASDAESKYGKDVESDSKWLEDDEKYYPDDLREAIANVKRIEVKKDECDDIKEKNKLIKVLISYQQDVVDLKRHYGYEVAKIAKPKKFQVEHFDYDEAIEAESLVYDSGERLRDLGLLEHIDAIVQDMCTPKQYRVFYMYYKIGMTQQDIAGVVGITQQAVQDIVRRVTNCIKSNI